MKTQGTAAAVTASVKGAGLAYKVGLGVILAGGVVFASSSFLGGVVFAAVMDILSLLGAPEDRQFLPPNEPEAGKQILQLHGSVLLACGICIVTIRLVAELLGLAGKPEFTGKLGGTDKLGMGAAASGVLAIVSTGLVQNLLYEIFLYEYGSGSAMAMLETAGTVGAVVLFGGLAVLILRGSRWHRMLGWTGRVGWGKMGCGWINKLGLGSIVLALIGGTLTPGFAEVFGIVAAAGIGILLVGIVPHILAGGRP